MIHSRNDRDILLERIDGLKEEQSERFVRAMTQGTDRLCLVLTKKQVIRKPSSQSSEAWC